MSIASPGATTAALLGLALSLHGSPAGAQSRAAGDYVLLAGDGISASRLTVTDGDVAVLDGTFTSTRALGAPSSALAAPAVRLDDAAVCGALFAASTRGGSPGCTGRQTFRRPFPSVADACAFPMPFPACDPTQPPVVIPHGATVALPPGVYGDVRVEGGAGGPATLLLAGTYRVCNLRALREARVYFTDRSTLLVAGTFTGGNGVEFGPTLASGVSPAQVDVFVAGSLVRFSRKSSLAAHLCAPAAALRVGSRGVLRGQFAAATMRLRQTLVSPAAVGEPGSTTTTTTTTLPAGGRCGDGVLDPGEVCEGDVACSSPGGSFLACSACAAFTSGPCAPATTTTTTTTLPGAAPAPRCGDGVTDPGEACDDGNTAACDGCDGRCATEAVGNGVVDCDETCDDGNTRDCDGCDGDGQLECGNETIDVECGEVCDGADVAGQTCVGDSVTCAPDCRRVDRSACPATPAMPQEICGNCVDDDLNGRIDFEDAACCPEHAAFAGTLDRVRLKPRRGGGTLLRLHGRFGGKDLVVSPATDDVFLQVRNEGGATLLCARMPAGTLRARHAVLRFRDLRHRVSSAQSLDVLRLRRTPRGVLRARAVGRSMRLEMPNPGNLRVTVGFTDPAVGPASNRCATMTATLRAVRRGGLRAP